MMVIFTIFFTSYYQIEDVQLVKELYFPKHATTYICHNLP